MALRQFFGLWYKCSNNHCIKLQNHFRKQYATIASLPVDFSDPNVEKYLDNLRKKFYIENVDYSANTKLSNTVNTIEKYFVLKQNLTSQMNIDDEKDEEMRKLMMEENTIYNNLIEQIKRELSMKLLELVDLEDSSAVFFEIKAGAGGQEAMLFAKDLFKMYINYFDYNEWDYEILEADKTDIGGLRHANVAVNDPNANILYYEAGVHRVQRVPSTEKSGRLHTSTASVTVFPQKSDSKVAISEKDIKIETKRASGAGGQHVNTTDSAVRIIHIPTGLTVESQSERSQQKNREIALKRLESKLVFMELNSYSKKSSEIRKSQQGHLNRNEKIRTYNFPQDRITDHRLDNGTVHNIQKVLEGGANFNDLVQNVAMEYRRRKFVEMIKNYKE